MDNFGTFHLITYIGLLFLLSQIFGRISKYLNMPPLIGYLTAGIILGPSLLNLFSEQLINEHLSIITDITLSIIAFSIGGSLKLKKLKNSKRPILWITGMQAILAGIFVFVLAMIFLPIIWPEKEINNGFLHSYFPIACLLGAISISTAPAAIIAIVHEYKAKGIFTTILMGIITLDDALALFFYAFSIAIAKSLVLGAVFSWLSVFFIPLFSMGIAILLGIIIGWIFRKIIFYFGEKDVLLGLITGAILLISGLGLTFNFSPLLANMTLGFMIVNFVEHARSEETFKVIESIEEPIFGIFFLLAGAQLHIQFAWNAILLAVLILIGRFTGKLIGTYFGATVSSALPSVKRYLGLALLPTAGITVGLALDIKATFSSAFPALSALVLNGVIGATLVNALIAPFLLLFSLRKAGDIRKKTKA